MTWRKATASADVGACVWVDIQPDVVRINTTSSTDVLTCTHAEWAAFLAGAKAGEFDLEDPTA